MRSRSGGLSQMIQVVDLSVSDITFQDDEQLWESSPHVFGVRGTLLVRDPDGGKFAAPDFPACAYLHILSETLIRSLFRSRSVVEYPEYREDLRAQYERNECNLEVILTFHLNGDPFAHLYQVDIREFGSLLSKNTDLIHRSIDERFDTVNDRLPWRYSSVLMTHGYSEYAARQRERGNPIPYKIMVARPQQEQTPPSAELDSDPFQQS